MLDTTEDKLRTITADEGLLNAAAVVHDAMALARVLIDVTSPASFDVTMVARMILDEQERGSYVENPDEEES